ncbi:MAG: gliding motility-associated C-terminal domain-containing protein, partial [Chitinophagaceae bacterium]
NYTIIVKDVISACVSTGTTVTVNIVAPPSPAPIITSPVNYCQNDRAIALNALGINLLWYTSAIGGTGTSTAPTPNTAAIGSNSFYVSQTLIGFCESARVPVLVNVFANPTAYAGGPIIDVFPGQTITLNGAATGNNISILWSPASLVSNPIIANPSINLQYDQLFTIRVNSADGCSATDQVKVNVLLALIIPNVFSPNGDNINDTWAITNIEKYPTARIEIFNRYGQSIFVSTGYQNNWKGTYAGKDLPVGTYYWIINNPRLNNKMSGAVSIIR